MEVDDIPQEEEDELAHAQNQLALQQAIALSQLDAAQAQARASSSGSEGTPPLFPAPKH
jgi:multidrug efflux pump subunit AcrA (membrane-fusion protein)